MICKYFLHTLNACIYTYSWVMNTWYTQLSNRLCEHSVCRPMMYCHAIYFVCAQCKSLCKCINCKLYVVGHMLESQDYSTSFGSWKSLVCCWVLQVRVTPMSSLRPFGQCTHIFVYFASLLMQHTVYYYNILYTIDFPI